MSAQVPSVGRIVHYYPAEIDGPLPPGPIAAIITAVGESSVTLAALPPMPHVGEDGVRRSSLCLVMPREEGETGEAGTWCWPPRVP